ncbi:MAG: lipopolysaccharide biosynthesis protein [Rikenellaceae bacterium]|jgi:O-antigen/teichoic acid export membrane protein|nr:lipopolysaccharide biosynthesis protein [Rikenellaceae bacterium]
MTELKNKVVRGFTWSIAEKIASALFQVFVSIKLLNRIAPADYGVWAILIALLAVFNAFVDSGFSQALIRKPKPTERDFSSVFYFNIAISAVVYALLVGLAYPASRLLEMPTLVALAPIIYLVVPLGALGIIQRTVMTREFSFGKLSGIGFASTIVAGVVAIAMAEGGCGVWSLVGQRLALSSVTTVLIWFYGRWRPRAGFSAGAIRGMFGYSSRLLATDMINNLYSKIPQFVIGGSIDKATLGLYDTAQKIKDMPLSATMSSMQTVTFPALANLAGNDRKFADGVGQVVSSIAFVIYPVMVGLIAVAPDFFELFVRAEWQRAIPFFQILCLVGLFLPITTISHNAMKARSNGSVVVRTEVAKKVLATVILVGTIPFGAIAIAWGQVGIALTDMVVSFGASRRYSGYGFGRLVRDMMPVLALTAVMFVVVWGVGLLAGSFALWLQLVLKIVTGVVVYFSGAALFRLAAFAEFTQILRKIAGRAK